MPENTLPAESPPAQESAVRSQEPEVKATLPALTPVSPLLAPGGGCPRKSRTLLWCLLTFALGALGTLGSTWLFSVYPSANPQPQSASSQPPSANLPGEGVVCLGSVDIDGGILSLYPLVPGRVAEIPVAENEAVRAGTVLLRLE